MTYSAAVFAEPISADEALEAAQARKIRAAARPAGAEAGPASARDRLRLGLLAEIAARDYGVRVTGLTLSAEQKAFAEARLARAGLADGSRSGWPTIARCRDGSTRWPASRWSRRSGRNIGRLISRAIARALPAGGRAALQLISIRDELFESLCGERRFHPDLCLPGRDADRRGPVSRDRREPRAWDGATAGYGLHYAETLRRWRERYDHAVSEEAAAGGLRRAFHRLWRYYLMYCEGGFRGGGIDVAQVTLVKRILEGLDTLQIEPVPGLEIAFDQLHDRRRHGVPAVSGSPDPRRDRPGRASRWRSGRD